MYGTLAQRLFEGYAFLACAMFAIGAASQGARFAWAAARFRALPRAPADARGGLPDRGTALGGVLIGAWRCFAARANPAWTVGSAAYHLAIAIVVSTYAVSAACLGVRLGKGAAVPDALSGLATADARRATNLAALVFGNAEPVPGRFLFGRLAGAAGLLSSFDVALAVLGNACLLVTVLRGRGGAVLRDLDAAAGGVRRPGARVAQHVAVRGLVFAIIQSEILTKLHVWPGALYLHSLLGLAFLALVPFCYVRHVFWAPAAIYLGYRRRREGVVA